MDSAVGCIETKLTKQQILGPLWGSDERVLWKDNCLVTVCMVCLPLQSADQLV